MNFANRLTIARIVFVPLFVTCLIYFSPERSYLGLAAQVLFVLACLTDALDGYWARKMGQQTVLGSYIDPLADKLLLLSGFVSLTFMPHLPESMRIPAWVTIPVIARDVVILLGSALIFVSTGKLEARPLLISKVTTVLQMATLFFALVGAPRPVQEPLFFGTLIFTIVSGFRYIGIGGRQFET